MRRRKGLMEKVIMRRALMVRTNPFVVCRYRDRAAFFRAECFIAKDHRDCSKESKGAGRRVETLKCE